jgi:hypothetical protein
VTDANNVNLGELISQDFYGVTIKSSTGYYYSVGWDAAFFDSQVYFSGAACTGANAWLNEGGTGGTKVNAHFLTWVSKNDQLYRFTNLDPGGETVTSVALNATSLWNYGSCGGGGANTGWPLVTITRTAAGVPATILAPLTIN